MRELNIHQVDLVFGGLAAQCELSELGDSTLEGAIGGAFGGAIFGPGAFLGGIVGALAGFIGQTASCAIHYDW